MRSKFLISLTMINYNRGAFIEDAILSVINQNSKNWELIIVDDGSKDNSKEIISKYSSHENIKPYFNSKNKGICYSRKKAISKSSGDIIGIIDSDDYLEKNAVEEVLKIYQKKSGIFVYSQMLICDENLKPTRVGANAYLNPRQNNLIENRISHFLTFKREDYFKTSGYYGAPSEDKDIIYKLEEIATPYFIDKNLYKYRMNSLSVSNYGWKKIKTRLIFLIVKIKAYRRRKINKSEKQINIIDIFPWKKLFKKMFFI